MNRDRLDALVVGGGVVGSALALGLKQRGLDVALVESAPAPAWRAESPDLRVYAVAPDSEALLQSLGVWSAIRAARAQPYAAMRVWDAGGGGTLGFDASSLGVPRLGHIVEHGLLVDRLQAAVCAAGIPVETTTLEAIEQGPEGADARLGDGRRRGARQVFGADGAASAVREAAGIPLASRDYTAKGLVAYLRPGRSHQDTCWQRFLPSGPLALLPCVDGRVSIVWSLPEAEADRLLAVPVAQFEAELTRASDRVLGELVLDSPRVAFPLRRQLAARMREGAVSLVGDAAHVVHPLAGQGVNLGLRDVGDLLSAIDAAIAKRRVPLSGALLDRWARRRHSENHVAARSFEAIHDVYANAALPAVALRGWVLGAANLPPVNRLLWSHAAGAA